MTEEFGLPDEFHNSQPKLLRETCKLKIYPSSEYFIGTDINVYYDVRHPRLYERPDWFLSLEVTIASYQEDMRWYALWEEGVGPFLVVELLSAGTQEQDFGSQVRELGKPPGKWEVYEQFLRVPFYVVFDRYQNEFRVFALDGSRYRQEKLGDEQRVWFDKLELGLGVWQGVHQGFAGKWLRWYDASGEWIPTDAEARHLAETQVDSERSTRVEAEAKLTAAILPLIGLGLTVEQIANSLGLTIERVNQEL